ncbi:hypothetical protein [Hymenobacter rigui]|uniref:DM13 domain-containing protein n=1 Tax=Hymenobacter rigui TaxID=334424 RepID=A0A428KTF0_9BACT|nr:hypothetical protein [Hymenobacter rigui]RSK49908.1 hypothetical protein EI291_04480 [Hymenobacter rigui]
MPQLLKYLPLLGLLAAGSTACSSHDDAADPQPAAVTDPATLTTLKTGSVVAQGGTSSKGTLLVARNAAGKELVRLNPDFMTEFHTGSVAIYLARSADQIRVQRAANPANVLKVGVITQNGLQDLVYEGSHAGFTHVVLYCEAAQYNFGAAELK